MSTYIDRLRYIREKLNQQTALGPKGPVENAIIAAINLLILEMIEELNS